MKKIIAILASVVMLGSVSCGSKTSTNSTTSKQEITSTVESSSVDSSTVENVENVEKTEVETETVAKEDKDYINWWGLNMYCPDEYDSDGMIGITQYYVYDKSGEEYKKKRCMVFYTYAHPEVDTMTPESVKDLMYEHDFAYYGLSAYYRDEIIKENNVISEEKVTVNGCECIRQEGTLHCDDLLEPHDYFYVAYFGVLDFPMQGKQPAMMIAFTPNLDDESKAEVIHDIDTAAQNAAPVEDSIT